MGMNELEKQVAVLVADTESVLLSPSAQKLGYLVDAAAEISDRIRDDFQRAADLYNRGDTRDGLSALRVAAADAENWITRLMNS